MPQPIQFPSRDGQTAHALYYPPTNPEVTGPAAGRPPLLVQAHPGPTADAKGRLNLRIQFFTSRGFAVVDVNYAGSTGYGRGYRERLTGQWGVADCLDAARSLMIQAGEVDGRRLMISGESAGGFTALCALASEKLFALGASRFGIADLETFRQQAPKFQAHELDRLVGPIRKRWPPTGPAHRCTPSIGLPARCCWCMGWRTLWCRRAKPKSWPRRLSARAFGTFLAFPGEGHGLRRPESIRRALEVELSFYVACSAGAVVRQARYACRYRGRDRGRPARSAAG
jgi:dipeptidyl aminopeptidase/acylaminoacyl peptidase